MPRDDSAPFGVGAPLPPTNLDAEAAVLGCVLARNDEIHRIGSLLDEDSFAHPTNGKLWAIISQEVRAGRRCDGVTLKVRLQNAGLLDEVGGTTYLAHLLASHVATSMTLDYANAVRDSWLRRQLAEAATDLHHLAHGADATKDGQTVLSEHLAGLSQLASMGGAALDGVMTLGEAARLAVSGYEAVYRGEPSPALLSGFVQVDNALGGFVPGHLVILGGRSRHGKTSLAQQLAEGVAGRLADAARDAPPFTAAGGYALMFSQEMPAVELGGRSVAAATGLDSNALARGEFGPNTAATLIRAQQDLDGVPLLIDDRAGLTVEDLILIVRAMMCRYRIRFVVIDHLKKMKFSRHMARLGPAIATEHITSSLKDAAKQLKVCIMLLAQFPKDVDKRPDPRPQLADLAYAGEADADTVALLWRPELYHPSEPPVHKGKGDDEAWAKRKDDWERKKAELKGKAELIISKRRAGPEGSVWLDFDPIGTTFRVPGIRYGQDNPADEAPLWEAAQ